MSVTPGVHRSERTVVQGRAQSAVDRSDTPSSPAKVSDAEIVRAAQLDPAAFGALYTRYRVRIYRYLRLRTGSDDEAADLTQQVFLRAIDALPGYQERGLPLAAWLFRIARNAAANAHRGRGRTVALDDAPDSVWRTDAENPEAIAIQNERLAHLRTLYGQLDAGKQELLALRFGAGLSSREIAPIVGRSEAAVKKQLTRIIHTLRERYGDA
ncbi:MAG TPA: RNA polymerase sigma factor [Thermomicrobiales bacterium]|nr:RNA polymerase sigma factor [Thermomicrobiales bacterium]